MFMGKMIHKRPRSQRKRMLEDEDEGVKLFLEKEQLALAMFKPDPEREGRLRAERKKKAQEKIAKISCETAELALKHFNETKQGIEYELVCDLENIPSVKRGEKHFDHLNFLAKPKGAADDETSLFFAERLTSTITPLHVTCCRLLGPKGVVTSAQGCRSCSKGGPRGDDSFVQHPVDGGFTRGLKKPWQF